jgi:hypothetical protein
MGDFGLDMDGIMEKIGEYGKSSEVVPKLG